MDVSCFSELFKDLQRVLHIQHVMEFGDGGHLPWKGHDSQRWLSVDRMVGLSLECRCQDGWLKE